MYPILLRITKKLMKIMTVVIIIFAVLVCTARLFFPQLNQHKAFFENKFSQLLHQKVSINSVSAMWYGLEPVIRFNGVVIGSQLNDAEAIEITQIAVGLNLLKSLIHRQLSPSYLFVRGGHFSVKQDRLGHVSVEGIHSVKSGHSNAEALSTLLQGMTISLAEVNIDWQGPDQKILKLLNLHGVAEQERQYYLIKGAAGFAGQSQAKLTFVIHSFGKDWTKLHQHADIYAQLDHLDLASLDDLTFDKIKSVVNQIQSHVNLHETEASVQLWTTLKHGHLQNLQGMIQLNKLGLHHLKRKKELLLNQISANFYWQYSRGGWQLNVDPIKVSVASGLLQSYQITVQKIRLPGEDNKQLLVHSDHILLENLRPFIQFFAKKGSQFQKYWQQLDPKGDLIDVNFTYQKDVDGKFHYQLKTQFNHLAVSAWQHIPALSGLSGVAKVSPGHGELSFKLANTNIDLPKLFSHPIALKTMNVQLNYTKMASGLGIDISQLDLDTDALRLKARLKLHIPHLGSPVIDLSSNFDWLDLGRISNYVPRVGLSKDFTAWLKQAFLSGQASGSINWQGSIADFPYEHQKGHLQAVANLQDVSFRYNKAWPVIQDFNAKLVLNNQQLLIQDGSGITVDSTIDAATGRIENLRHPTLVVHGHSKTTLVKAMSFLKASPLPIAQNMKNMQWRGPVVLDLHVTVLLADNKKDTDVSGALTLQNDTLKIADWNLRLNNIRGHLKFHNLQLTADDIQTEFLSSPMKMSVNTILQPDGLSTIFLSMLGEVKAEALRKQFDLKILDFVQGKTQYQAILNIRNGQSALGNSLLVSSNLEGMTANLPKPLFKTVTQKRSFTFSMDMFPHSPVHMFVHYDKVFSAALTAKRSSSDFGIASGELRLGAGNAQLQTLPGLSIEGVLQEADGAQWQEFLTQYLHDAIQASKSAQLPAQTNVTKIRRVALNVEKLNYLKQHFNNVFLQVLPDFNGWSMTINNDKVSGVIFIPSNPTKLWQLRLEQLDLSSSQGLSGKSLAVDFANFPPLDITINDFRYANKQWGKIHLSTIPSDHGITLNRLYVINPLMNVAMRGQWIKNDGKSTTKLLGKLNIANLGQFLNHWDITHALLRTNGVADFSLEWSGSPAQFNKKTLAGYVTLDLRKGRIIELSDDTQSKIGLGHLLNFFSLQSLARHLESQLDSASKKGFSFSKMQGDFVIKKGIATTDNAHVSGGVATVNMQGLIDFTDRQYNLTLTVMPHVTHSLPLIAGVIGGPVAAAVMFAADRLVGEKIIEHIAKSVFNMKGSWDKPDVKKISKTNGHA